MGIGSFFKKAGRSIKKGFKKHVSHPIRKAVRHARKSVARTATSFYHKAKDVTIEAVDTVGPLVASAVGTVRQDAKDLISGSAKIAQQQQQGFFDAGNNLVSQAGQTVGGLGENLALPLVLLVAGGGVIAFTMYMT